MRRLSQRRLRSLSVLLCAAVLTVLGGCADPAQDAGFQIARGDLDAAERTLAGVESTEADRLRDRIREYREERTRAAVEIDRLVALAAQGDEQRAKAELRELSSRARDARTRELYDTTLSSLADAIAESAAASAQGRAAGIIGSTELPRFEEDDSTELAIVDSMVSRIVDSVEQAIADGEWSTAHSLISMVVSNAGDQLGRLEALRTELERGGLEELDSLLASADQVYAEKGAAAAYNLLVAHSSRFPAGGALGEYQERLSELRAEHFESERALRESVANQRRERLAEFAEKSKRPNLPVSPGASGRGISQLRPGAGRASPGSNQPPPEDDVDAEAIAVILAARDKEEAGDLSAALQAWKDAAADLPRGLYREHAENRARDLEARATLRREVASSFQRRGMLFGALGIEEVQEDRFVVSGEPIPWREMPLETLERVVLITELSNEARVGWVQERLVRDDPEALVELAALLARGEVEEEQAWSIVAAERREQVPEKGYAFADGAWIDKAERDRQELMARLSGLKKRLENANPKKRDEAFAALVEVGPEADPVIEAALRARWEKALARVDGSVLGKLNSVAERRAELDRRRAAALDLIFDEEEYFYPYRPPECPPDKARLYPAVQRRVDELVLAVSLVWNDSRSAKLSKPFKDGVEELEWNRMRQAEIGFSFALPDDLPEWFPYIDTALDEITVRSFARDQEEYDQRRYDRSVLAYNEHNWKTYDGGRDYAASESDAPEQEQVRITNEYRLMFGRRALVWNPLIQAAAQGHADWMTESGKFSHFNDEDPERTTPGDRMRLEGYNYGVSENLYAGGAGPDGAHYGWVHSSGHHRNILAPSHREMGSALSGMHWCQNYGGGRGFLEELKAWYD